MNNNGATPLDTNSGWENIVNSNAAQVRSARERVSARKLERKRRKLKMAVILLAAVALTFVILGISETVAAWLASIVASLCLYGACFQFGRFLEVNRK